MNKCKLFLIISALSFLPLLLLLQGCGHSKLVTSWMNDSKPGYRLSKVLVIAVFKDPITRKIYENSFINLLKNVGVEAFPGSAYRLGSNEPNDEDIASALTKTGAGSILITHILSKTKSTYTVAPEVDYASYFTYWDSFYGYHSYVYEQTFAPAETIETRHERMAVTLFDADRGKPVWSAISESVNFEDRLRVDDEELEKLFINDLKEKQLL
jgi:hypothetical protein